MYGKIENNQLILAKNKILVNNGWVTNPSEIVLQDLGFLKVIHNNKPDYDDEEEKLQEVYAETYINDTKVIVVDYDVIPLTDDEHNVVIQQKIEDEEKRLTQRRQREFDLKQEGALSFVQEIERNIQLLRTKFR